MTDNELGLFLRRRREAVSPAEVGLPTGHGRRTPGLRRSELATLAGVSVEYVTRLEQGRDRRPSPEVLAALADVLRLAPNERIHLYRLTKGANGFSCLGDAAPARTPRSTVLALLHRLEPAPAVLLNRVTDLVAHTAGYARLVGPIGQLDGSPPNLARFVFTDPRARAAYPDWDRVADEAVATLKEGPFRVNRFVATLADELTIAAGEAFVGRVETVSGLPRASGVVRLVHPEAGELRLAYETLELPVDDDQRLVVYLPADEATSAALDSLTGRRPGALRAVSG
ncbi:helix-turn-helix domain-containing protein [Frankia sp. CNm7]|uniref:Helix-turn-helix domain-containing protein n=1 Tax=Frankia nepalensis TaxID=1836974 RepID=A0A937RIG4_9ACTN|nr:helix-turn-helix transcriptional regulator [Frankia nepalensis]MBL7500442.1 helix-turn-helix domain-containing protein [Frankia nepalensis]MBL7511197.1 helix-turn-helix domain-containing protein [Frankia nepalensis]MBL7522281.1 helix-turn-helix domain-containing protein [Frankia nepalensis]MBL7626963.1 helix-turn-helix domain-containing protein [Frankia nepalensis]